MSAATSPVDIATPSWRRRFADHPNQLLAVVFLLLVIATCVKEPSYLSWTGLRNTLLLAAPIDSTAIQVRFNIGQPIIDAVHKIDFKLYVNNQLEGQASFTERSIPILTFRLKHPVSGPVEVRLESSPGYTPPADGRSLGVAIIAIGFL